MKNILLILFILIPFFAIAQLKKTKPTTSSFSKPEKYFSFNPFGLLEPQIAVGAGFGNRFTKRSEYFTELSYIGTSHIYNQQQNIVNGFRFLAQYRYHFVQPWRPFVGVEFRLKPFNVSGNRYFVNSSTNDTLSNFLYHADAVSIGGAILFGDSYNISANGKWKFEVTVGLGAKRKFVKYTNLAVGYKPIIITKVDFGLPAIDEAVAAPYIPCTFRLRYIIN